MTSPPAMATDLRFRIAWWVMASVTGVSIVGHLSLMILVPDESVLFLGWAIFNLYALAVLVVPFRRGESWAWYASWLFAVPYLILIAFDADQGASYAVVGTIFAACLQVTRSAFFRTQ